MNMRVTLLRIAAFATALLSVTQANDAGRLRFWIVSPMTGYGQLWGLAEGSPGVFYGAASLVSAGSAAYSVSKQGGVLTLATFPPHYYIARPLVSGPNSLLYASVQHTAGVANVFSVMYSPGSATVYSGQTVDPELSQSLPDGTFLGVAANAENQLPWSVVNVGLSGEITQLYQFVDDVPISNALYATDGDYYGIAAATPGYVYKLTPSGTFSKLYVFPSTPPAFLGLAPASLLQARDNNLYGILPSGGANGTGAVFRLTLGGEYRVIYSFPTGPNGGPTSLIEGSDGNLYGATQGYVYGGPYGYGLLFRLTTAGEYTLLKPMDNGAATGSCQCTLTLGSDGVIYGTTTIGGPSGGGTVFALDVGMPVPKPRARQFTPESGPVGTKVTIFGSNLLSATVKFNGVTATSVSNSGPHFLIATAPPGATPGPITITTPGGTFTTPTAFIVQ